MVAFVIDYRISAFTIPAVFSDQRYGQLLSDFGGSRHRPVRANPDVVHPGADLPRIARKQSQTRTLRVRRPRDLPGVRPPFLGPLLPDRGAVHRVRRRDDLPLPLGDPLQTARLVWGC